MRKPILWLMLLAPVVVAAAAVSQETGKNTKPKKGNDDAAIRAAIDSYVEAYNVGDAERVADHWSDDAVYIRPDSGEKVTGRQAIQKIFADQFAAEKGKRLKVAVDSIRLVTPEVAIEDGIAWVISPSGEMEESTYTAVHVKRKEGWRLDSVRETTTPQEAQTAAATAYEHLQPLEWMIGEWVDESEESTVETVCKWTKNKSFLTRTFKVSAPGVDDLEGTQVVGWDPVAGVIRSWVFDSEGGYLEGTWAFKGGSWVVKSSGYLSDGRKASSVNIYTQVSDDVLTWKAVGRSVDGQFLPNIDEVKVSRKPVATTDQ